MFDRIRSIFLMILAGSLTVICFLVHDVELRAHQLKADEMELSSISYGLFNPDRWVDAIKEAVAKEVIDFRLEGEDRELVQTQLEKVLREVLDELRRTVDQNDDGVKGKLRKAVMKAVVPIDAIREDIPQYADRIIAEVDKPVNREKLKDFVLQKLDSLASKTSGTIDMHAYDEIMEKYDLSDPKVGITTLQHARLGLESKRTAYGWAILGGTLLMVLLLSIGAPPRPVDLALLVTTALVLLITALLMPMIDIEARITSFQLSVLGHPLVFTDQVLFYESRSILQVIKLLLKDKDPALILVAVLVFCFSVAFPFIKLILSFITALRKKIPDNAVLRFFVLKSAKWSMADVLVVAMFMTYLGFNGVVDGQLSHLKRTYSSVQIMTTNQSGLEFGFYLFTGFVLLGLVLSVFVERLLEREAQLPKR